MREKIICGLDIGSSKVCAVIAGYDTKENKLDILGVGEESCSGLKYGVVVNIDNTYRAITKAVESAEEEADTKVKDVVTNLNGSHISGHMHQGATKIPRSEREITEEDVERVISSARTTVPLSSDMHIIHAIPLDFIVDKQGGVENPIGMEGNHLEVKVMLITGSTAANNNLEKCITKAGLGIRKSVSTVLAPAETVVAEEEKDLGSILVDIGAQTTNIAMFVEGALNHIGELDIGSDFITRDLAHGLKTSFQEAKRIKENVGSVLEENPREKKIEYLGVDGQTKKTASLREINKIIEPRVEDIIDYIHQELADTGKQHMVPGGLILSGGGSQLKGIDKAIERKLEDFPVRMGRPRDLKGKVEKVNAPKYATAVGLMKYVLKTDNLHGYANTAFSGNGGFWQKIINWLEELF
ncbi:MAG: cell division protein FtsA [Elusimicrobiota bacterium]